MVGQRIPAHGTASDPILAVAAVLGTVDVGSFLLTRWRTLLSSAPGRLSGSVVGLALWAGLAVAIGVERSGRGGRRCSLVTTGLAALCGLGNLALMGVHLRVGKGQRRGIFGGILGGVALTGAAARTFRG